MFGRAAGEFFAQGKINLVNQNNSKAFVDNLISVNKDNQTHVVFVLSGIQGSIESPGFGQRFTPELYHQLSQYMGREVYLKLKLDEIKKVARYGVKLYLAQKGRQ